MIHRPEVAWPIASRLVRVMGPPGPEVSRPEAIRTVQALRATARRAGDLAREHSGLPGRAASDVVVVDRQGWARFATRLMRRTLDRLPLPPRPDGVRRRLLAVTNGVLTGGALILVSRALLGQYDPFAQQLVLLAPGIVKVQRRHRLVPEDLWLWVGLHEQTHAVQFSAAEWLIEHLLDLVAELCHDDPGPTEVAAGLLGGRGATALLVSEQGQETLGRLGAVMTLLEGHADFVAELAARQHIQTLAAVQRAFLRPEAGRGWHRLLPGLDKATQYSAGLAFCRDVAARAGAEALRAAYQGPANLPSAAEITAPESWLRRVHGQA